MKIGLDLDNTIINYNKSFCTVAQEKGWIDESHDLSKSEVKKKLVQEDGHDERWQVLQSLCYGPELSRAIIHEGVESFVRFCRANNFELIIISHKTKYSNYNSKVELRDAATQWLFNSPIISDKLIPIENVTYCSTVDEKVLTIKEAKCDLFIDDLEKIFTHSDFPLETMRILFSEVAPKSDQVIHIESWERILSFVSKEVDINLDDLKLVFTIESSYPDSFKPLKREGNNQIYLFELNKKKYILKKYYNSKDNENKRGVNEFSALTYLSNNGINNIPKPLAFNGQAAIYSFLEGHLPNIKEVEKLKDSFLKFIISLRELSNRSEKNVAMEATDSRLYVKDYFSSIDKRLLSIEKGLNRYKELVGGKDFFYLTLIPLKEKVFKYSMDMAIELGIDIDEEIDHSERILSPSDFGTHNCLLGEDGETYFIDFEYFGWDDPVKLFCDFHNHIGQTVSVEFKESLLKGFLIGQPNPEKFKKRYQVVFPLIQFEWILIAMNVFSAEKLERRLFASPHLTALDITKARLKKAQNLAVKFKDTFIK